MLGGGTARHSHMWRGEVADQVTTIPALTAQMSETEVKKPPGNSALACHLPAKGGSEQPQPS